MKFEIIGSIFAQHPKRTAGVHQVVYSVTTDSGKVGEAVLHYEYDKRDVMIETLRATPEIADEVRAFVGTDGPVASGFAFPKEEEMNKNSNEVSRVSCVATSDVYSFGD